jgi:hypothetical protein
MRGYNTPDELYTPTKPTGQVGFQMGSITDRNDVIAATILEAILATFAHSDIFGNIEIGDRVLGTGDDQFTVGEVQKEALHIWCPEALTMSPPIDCVIAIGPGRVDVRTLRYIVEGKLNLDEMAVISLEKHQEMIEQRMLVWAKENASRGEAYFAINVDGGNIWYRHWLDIDRVVEELTYHYLFQPERVAWLRECAKRLQARRNVRMPGFRERGMTIQNSDSKDNVSGSGEDSHRQVGRQESVHEADDDSSHRLPELPTWVREV